MQERVAGIDAGADDFLTKPVERLQLIARVRSLLRQKAYTDELERAASVLFALARSIEGKDPYPEGHCEQLAEHSVRLGEFLGPEAPQITTTIWLPVTCRGTTLSIEIRTKRVRKQKTARQDAQLLLRLMLEDRFPQIWVPSWENRDRRQLLWHRRRLVQARTRIRNQLQAVVLNEGLRCCKKRLWREAGREQLEAFRLGPWASQRRRDLLELLDRLDPTIAS